MGSTKTRMSIQETVYDGLWRSQEGPHGGGQGPPGVGPGGFGGPPGPVGQGGGPGGLGAPGGGGPPHHPPGGGGDGLPRTMHHHQTRNMFLYVAAVRGLAPPSVL